MTRGPSSYLALQAAARKVLPKTIGVSVVDPRNAAQPVLPEEAVAIRKAREARVREFSGGRTAARGALHLVGQEPQPIPMGRDRAPVWPDGMTGSITHDDLACLAIATRTSLFSAVGADLEPDSDLPAELIPEICTQAEQDWLATHGYSQQARLARMIFSAKECSYKCQYTLSGEMLEFHDLEVRFSDDLQSFTTRFLRGAAPFVAGTELEGHCLAVSGHILTLMTLSARHAGAAPSGAKASQPSLRMRQKEVISWI